ncbi:MAG: hypothetical protein QXG16_03795 [Candidatus Anstonellaceae archaeon]
MPKLLIFVSDEGINKMIEDEQFCENNREFFSKIEKIYLVYSEGKEEIINLEKFKKLGMNVEPIKLEGTSIYDSDRIVEEIKNKIPKVDIEEIIFDNKHGTRDMSEAAMSLYYSNPSSKLLKKEGKMEKNKWIYNTVKLSEKEEYYKKRRLKVREQIELLAKLGYFNSALELFQEEDYQKLFQTEGRVIELLKNCLEGMNYWVLFEHKNAAKKFGYVKKILEEDFHREENYLELREFIGTTIEFLNKMADKRGKSEECEELLVDRYNNMEICIQQARYDDAVARAYSLTEAIGRYELKKIIDIRKIENFENFLSLVKNQKLLNSQLYYSLKRELEEYFKKEEREPLKIGLTKTYLLLHLFENRVSKVFFEENKIKIEEYYEKNKINGNLLEKRNMSILAHGINPCNKEDAEKWKEMCTKLLQTSGIKIEDYPSIKKMLDKKILEIRKTSIY